MASRGNVETTLAGDIGKIREGLGAATPVEMLRARLGYQSEAAFAKAFKKAVGMGSGAYRRGPPGK